MSNVTRCFIIDLAVLLALGFVPNIRNPRYHTASVTIGGHTVWCKDFRKARKIANRIMHILYSRGLNVSYRVEDVYGNYQYNW